MPVLLLLLNWPKFGWPKWPKYRELLFDELKPDKIELVFVLILLFGECCWLLNEWFGDEDGENNECGNFEKNAGFREASWWAKRFDNSFVIFCCCCCCLLLLELPFDDADRDDDELDEHEDEEEEDGLLEFDEWWFKDFTSSLKLFDIFVSILFALFSSLWLLFFLLDTNSFPRVSVSFKLLLEIVSFSLRIFISLLFLVSCSSLSLSSS